MKFSALTIRKAVPLLFAMLLPPLAIAQDREISDAKESRIDESYGKWMVMCLPRNGERVCAVRQHQVDRQTGKLALLIELRPLWNGSAKGGIMLPKDFRPKTVVRLALDGRAAGSPLEVKECSDRGCVVAVTFAGPAFEKLRHGRLLELSAVRVDGAALMLQIDLNGFAAAVGRSIQLEKNHD